LVSEWLTLNKGDCCGLTRQLATRIAQPLTRHPQWDGEENGQKVKLVGGDRDSLMRQKRNYCY